MSRAKDFTVSTNDLNEQEKYERNLYGIFRMRRAAAVMALFGAPLIAAGVVLNLHTGHDAHDLGVGDSGNPRTLPWVNCLWLNDIFPGGYPGDLVSTTVYDNLNDNFYNLTQLMAACQVLITLCDIPGNFRNIQHFIASNVTSNATNTQAFSGNCASENLAFAVPFSVGTLLFVSSLILAGLSFHASMNLEKPRNLVSRADETTALLIPAEARDARQSSYLSQLRNWWQQQPKAVQTAAVSIQTDEIPVAAISNGSAVFDALVKM